MFFLRGITLSYSPQIQELKVNALLFLIQFFCPKYLDLVVNEIAKILNELDEVFKKKKGLFKIHPWDIEQSRLPEQNTSKKDVSSRQSRSRVWGDASSIEPEPNGCY